MADTRDSSDSSDIAAALGVWLDDARPVPGRYGQRRTFFARWNGEPVVVKWGLDKDLPEKIPYVAGQVPQLRRRGIPAAPVLAHAPISGGGYAWLQPRLPGRPAIPSPALLAELFVMLDRMCDAPPGKHRSDHNVWVTAVVRDDLAGYWANAAAVGATARVLCARIRAWATALASPPPVHDYVHVDFNLGNVLADGDVIVGLVDLENLGVGSRAVDAARLAYEWHAHGAPRACRHRPLWTFVPRRGRVAVRGRLRGGRPARLPQRAHHGPQSGHPGRQGGPPTSTPSVPDDREVVAAAPASPDPSVPVPCGHPVARYRRKRGGDRGSIQRRHRRECRG